MRKRTRKVAAKLQLIYETTKFFVSFCAFSGHFYSISAQKTKKSHIFRPKTAFLPNTRSVLTKRNECSYQTLSAFLQYCNPVPTKLFYKLVEFGNQSRRVWQPKSTSLVTKVDEFGHQGSQSYTINKFPLCYSLD